VSLATEAFASAPTFLVVLTALRASSHTLLDTLPCFTVETILHSDKALPAIVKPVLTLLDTGFDLRESSRKLLNSSKTSKDAVLKDLLFMSPTGGG